MTRKTRRKLMSLGVLLVPAVLVKGTALLLGNPVAQSASADVQETSAEAIAITPLNRVELTAAQRNLLQHIDSLRAKRFGLSPLYYVATEDGRPVETGPVQSADISVQAVMGATTGNKALVNGKVYQVGEKLANSPWLVSAIDASLRSITIRHETTGEIETHAVPIPGASE